MPTNCSPLPPSFACALTNSGISSRHGSHQVAQKFTIRTLPLHWSSALLPAIDVRQRQRQQGSPADYPARHDRNRRRRQAPPEQRPRRQSIGRVLWCCHRNMRVCTHTIARVRPTGRSDIATGTSASLAAIASTCAPAGPAAGSASVSFLPRRRIADADIGAALRVGRQDTDRPGRGAAQRQFHDHGSAGRFPTFPKNWSVLILPAGSSGAPSSRTVRRHREAELVAIQVIAVGNDESRLERAGLSSARAEIAECLLGRQEFGVRGDRGGSPAIARRRPFRPGRIGTGSGRNGFGVEPVEIGAQSIA